MVILLFFSEILFYLPFANLIFNVLDLFFNIQRYKQIKIAPLFYQIIHNVMMYRLLYIYTITNKTSIQFQYMLSSLLDGVAKDVVLLQSVFPIFEIWIQKSLKPWKNQKRGGKTWDILEIFFAREIKTRWYFENLTFDLIKSKKVSPTASSLSKELKSWMELQFEPTWCMSFWNFEIS
jgi:hypothetical protein